MRTAADQCVGQSCPTVESGAAVANKIISQIAIAFKISVENLFKYWLCGGKCPIRWLYLSKETKHKINSLFKCQYQAWKGHWSSLCSTCEYREVPVHLWVVLRGLLRAFWALWFWDSISANRKLEWCFTAFCIHLPLLVLTQYTVLIHGYFHPLFDVWF